jgi:hypothetical protein
MERQHFFAKIAIEVLARKALASGGILLREYATEDRYRQGLSRASTRVSWIDSG